MQRGRRVGRSGAGHGNSGGASHRCSRIPTPTNTVLDAEPTPNQRLREAGEASVRHDANHTGEPS